MSGPARDEVLTTITAHAPELRRMGVAALWVFGSVARGEARPDSDVDVLVELSRPLGLAFFDIQLALQGWLGRKVEVGTWESLHPRARKRARAEALRAA